ncbi:MAG: extracellular solute-binding protein [Lachnospiraceae bacterium]|nr:extracellular solute-binding protein [Lachnospiraceae bacterium]
MIQMRNGKKMAFLLCGLLLTGCGQTEQESPVEITMIHGWGGTVKTHALMQEIYDAFDQGNADIVLNCQPSSDSSIAVEKANNMLAVDKMPNIVSTNGQYYYVKNAEKKGKALDLMPYIQADETLASSISKEVLDDWTNEDGAIYTLPDALEIMGYWYNTKYFEAAGIVDDEGKAKPPGTWEEFYADCEKLKAWQAQQSDMEQIYALEDVQVVENLFLARLAGENAEGLAMVKALPEDFDRDTFRSVVTDFQKIWSYSADTDSLDNARQYFKEGKSAMYFNGIWERESFRDSKQEEDIAYANYPTNSGGSLSYISPSSGYVLYDSPDERQKEAEIRFLKYILSTEAQTKMAMETGQAPTNPNVDIDKITVADPLLGSALKEAHDADIQIRSISSVWNSERISLLTGDLKEASLGGAALEDMILRLNDAVE